MSSSPLIATQFSAMKSLWLLLILVATFVSSSAMAQNYGDFSGGVAIGSSYAGAVSAPSDGLLVQGGIGIGTATPLDTLQVYASGEAIEIGTSTAADTYMGVGALLGGTRNRAQFGYINTSYGSDNGYAYFGGAVTPKGAGIVVNGNSTPSLYINSSGNVGIGTTTPISLLHVFGASSTGTFVDSVAVSVTSVNRNATVAYDASSSYGSGPVFFNAGTEQGRIYYENPTNSMRFYTNNGGSAYHNERMRIDSSGNIGIGTTAARGGSLLDVNGKVYVATFASASSTTVCQNGNVLSSCSSARRYKEDIEPSDMGLKEVLAMKPVTFDFRDHKDNWEKHDFGFVAEDMEKINPLFVTYNADGEIEGVRYMQLTAVNARAIQELNELVTDQQTVIEHQQAEIDELRQMIGRLGHEGKRGSDE
jgi:hypothetical protein